jgi:hypothetical protein
MRWGLGFFAYSSEKYELSIFPSGEFFGPTEDAFEVSANLYCNERPPLPIERRD